jgi:hypothetical protein
MKTIKEKINGMVSVNPPSEYIKVCDLTTPRWIRFTVNFIFLLMLVIILLRLFRSPLYFLLVVGVLGAFIPTTFISIYLHEKCHQVIFEMLTGKPAIIRLSLVTSSCRPTVPCSVPAYLAAQIFPLITTATLGVITSVLYIFNASLWIIFAFILTTIHSFLGSSVDLYWAFKLRNFPTNYVAIDHGTWAEVYAPSRYV